MNKRKKKFLAIFTFVIICNFIVDFYASIFSVEIFGNDTSIFVYHMLWAFQGAGWIMIGDWLDNKN